MIGNKLEPFKFWCQKVLPNVYDDSLSYYEYLCKLNEYLNEVIEQINTLTDNMEDYESDLSAQWLDYKTDLTNQWTETKNYIDNYFNNLNVQTEINNKLDVMASDGTLDALLLPYFNEYKSDINTIVSNQNQTIATLSARVSEIATLPSGSTSGDAELIDIRTPTTGLHNNVAYDSAGDSVRGQAEEIYAILRKGYTWEKGSINSSDGTDQINSRRIRSISKIPLKYLFIRNGYKAIIYAYNSSNTYIGTYNTSGFDSNGEAFTGFIDLSNYTYNYRVAIQRNPLSADIIPSEWGQAIDIFDNLASKAILNSIIDGENIRSFYPITDGYELGYYNASTGVFTELSQFTSLKLSCKPYEKYMATGYIGGSSATAFVIFENNSGTVVDTIGRGADRYYTDEVITIPDGVYYVIFCTNGTNTDPLIVKKLYNTEYSLSKYNNKWVSILGDSISSFKNWTPYPNNDYYDGIIGDVKRVTQCWWYELINQIGAKLLVDNAGGSSTVSGDSSYKMSNPVRCQSGLQKTIDGVLTRPDIIIVEGGINDFSDNVAIGNWDGHQAIPTYPQTNFREAYSCMLNNIKSEFPTAEVFCCTLFVGDDGPFGYIPKNNNDTTLREYNEAIKEIANIYGCKIIPFDEIGITSYTNNAYTVSPNPSPLASLHPNNIGMKMLARAAINTFKQ